MNSGKTLFAQLMAHLPWTTFSRIVTKYRGTHRVRAFPCTEHYRVMAFAQLTYRESIQNFLSQQDAASYMKQMEAESTPVHTLDVPESMKQQIKTKGFPLYSRNTLGGLLEQANA